MNDKKTMANKEIMVFSEAEAIKAGKMSDFTYECECSDCPCPDGDCCTDY